MLFESFIFAVAGLGLEVVFTSVFDFFRSRHKHLFGYSSLWYVPIYSCVPVVFHYIYPYLFAWPIYGRALFYLISFWMIEYLSMGLLRILLGSSPSEESYRKSGWSIHGLTRLDYAPAQVGICFLFEWMFRHLRGLQNFG